VADDYISPKFKADKLSDPTFEDLVDVYEDRMRGWFLRPTSVLKETPHCEPAAIGILFLYFEGIEIYMSGEDSNGDSKRFFSRGFLRVFPREVLGPSANQVLAHLYKEVRCGFAHEGTLRSRTLFSLDNHNPITITYPKSDGRIDVAAGIESVLINPRLLFDELERHFGQYIDTLRSGDAEAKESFENAVKLKWALNEPDRVIGISQEEFLGRA